MEHIEVPKFDSFAVRFQRLMQDLDLARAKSVKIAAELGISESTLRRRLAAMNISLQEAVTKERRRRCQEHFDLKGREASATELMERCGYGHPQSFYRAFPGFYGCTFTEAVRYAIEAQRYHDPYTD